MEQFKGNGAECMVQFIKDGCNGAVFLESSQFPEINKRQWLIAGNMEWSLAWLAAPCVYVSPEPVYRSATPGEALDAWLAGKEVQAQHLHEPEDWYVCGEHTSVWSYVRSNRFRIRQD